MSHRFVLHIALCIHVTDSPSIIPTLIAACIVRVVKSVTIAINIIAPALHVAYTFSDPVGDVVRDVFDILDSVVKAVLDSPLGAVVIILNVLWDVLDLSNLQHTSAAATKRAYDTGQSYLTTSPSGHSFGCIFDVFDSVVELVLHPVLVLIPILLNLLTLMHQQRTACQSCCGTHCHSPVVVMLLLLARLFVTTSVSSLLAVAFTIAALSAIASTITALLAVTAAARVLECPLAVGFVDEQPAALAFVPDGTPWWGDLRWWSLRAASSKDRLAVAFVSTSVAATLTTVTSTAAAAAALMGEFVDEVTEKAGHGCCR